MAIDMDIPRCQRCWHSDYLSVRPEAVLLDEDRYLCRHPDRQESMIYFSITPRQCSAARADPEDICGPAGVKYQDPPPRVPEPPPYIEPKKKWWAL